MRATLEIQAFSRTAVGKKRLRQRAHVLRFAPINKTRGISRVFCFCPNCQIPGVLNMAKKGGAPTKSEILNHIAKDTDLSRKQVAAVFDSLAGLIKKSLRSNGLFTLPGLMKLKVVKKPATKAREGVNPFTGEKMMFKAKPASKKVRGMPLKSLKSMVN